MRTQVLSVLAVSLALALTGCGPSDEPQGQAAQPSSASPPEQTLSEKAAELAKGATQSASEKVEAAATAASQAAGAAKETVSEAAGAAMEKGQAIAQAGIDKATALIQEVKDYIAENKIDLAEKVMGQLRQLRDSLPRALQDEIARLETMLGGAESGAAPAGG